MLILVQIATPGHELYGQHLSQHVIDAMIAPKDESKTLVMNWLSSEGLSKYASLSPRSDNVIVEASISTIEKLLKAEYKAFSKTLPRKIVRLLTSR
jgi:tripeptidyl-peptidase-1